ncbi:MAG TPA: hypothetical protein VFI47_19680, partial [Acidimicrobiales bacterium]|nr:hypothetical protein [Acidimicrobiales bacterium]
PVDEQGGRVPTPSGDGDPVPPGPGAGNRFRLPVLVGSGVVVAALLAGFLIRSSTGGGDGGAADAGVDAARDIGDAMGPAASVPSDTATAGTTDTAAGDDAAGDDAGDGASHPELPPVTTPAESVPPTTIPGSQPSSIPDEEGGETARELPLFGHIVVDLPPGGYLDFAVRLRRDQLVTVLSLVDDGIMTDIEVFGPDGRSEGGWSGGEPGVTNGIEWNEDDRLPVTGTYVIRVVHTGGSDGPFLLAFYGDA